MAKAKDYIKRTIKGIREHQLTNLAAMLTYYAIFALFPFLLFLVTVTLLVLPSDTLHQAFGMASVSMPEQMRQLMSEQLTRLEHTASGGFAIVGALVALWGASRGTTALMTALNNIHGVKETRPWWKQQLVALGVTLAVVVLALISLGLLVVGPLVAGFIEKHVGLATEINLVVTIGRWVGAALLMMLVWAIIYYFLPNLRRPFRWVTPGAIVGVILWIAATLGFSEYVAHFGKYERTYGALGAVIIFITWLWISAVCLLIGGEVDDTVDELHIGHKNLRRKEKVRGREPEEHRGPHGGEPEHA